MCLKVLSALVNRSLEASPYSGSQILEFRLRSCQGRNLRCVQPVTPKRLLASL